MYRLSFNLLYCTHWLLLLHENKTLRAVKLVEVNFLVRGHPRELQKVYVSKAVRLRECSLAHNRIAKG